MYYSKQNWSDSERQYTPITAESMNYIEDGIQGSYFKKVSITAPPQLVNYSNMSNNSYMSSNLVVLNLVVMLSRGTNWTSENNLTLGRVEQAARPSSTVSTSRTCILYCTGGSVFMRGVNIQSDGYIALKYLENTEGILGYAIYGLPYSI